MMHFATREQPWRCVRPSHLLRAAAFALGLLAAAPPDSLFGAEPELADIFGGRHYLADFVSERTEAVVVVVLDDECPVVQQEIPALLDLYRRYNSFAKDRAGRPTEFAKYPGDRVAFLGIYVKPDIGAKGVASHAAAKRIPFRVLRDADQALVRQLGLTRLSEVAVLDRQFKVRYRGPVDDQSVQGAVKPAATKHYLADALESVLAHQPVAVASRPAVGCKITAPPAAAPDSPLTYNHDVALIMQKHCQSCHREGEVAPMPLETYAQVVAYADMVEEVVLDRRMPPYPGETTRKFASDERLTEADRRTLIDWLRSARVAGDPADAPAPIAWAKHGDWTIGQPDFVFRMPQPFQVPATGVLNYVYIPVPVNGGKGFPEDRWIASVETHPGARQVVHHVQVHEYFGPIDHDPTPLDQILIYGLGIESARLIGSYTPGNEEGNNLNFNRYHGANRAGKQAGVKLSKGANLMFEVHYTTNGTAMPDQSEVGIKFADRKPDVLLQTWFPFRSRADMIVPANVANHSLQDLYHFGRVTNGRAVLLHGMRPHMHSRGKSFRIELVDAKGMSLDVVRDFSQHDKMRGEEVLSIPVWDFSWQRFYQFEEPILIRPDQALLATAYWDNTEFNPRNPDPNVDAPWGQQTIQEMFNTLLLYEVLEPDDPRLHQVAPSAVAEVSR